MIEPIYILEARHLVKTYPTVTAIGDVSFGKCSRGREMAYDEKAAARVRGYLAATPNVNEIKMMGGLIFTVNSHMRCGVTGPALMVRVGPDAYATALDEPLVRPMEIVATSTPGFVCVDPEGYATDDALAEWVGRGIAFVSPLSAKDATGRKAR